MRRVVLARLAAGLVAAVAAGCASPGYDPASLRADLVEAGLSPDEARCVVREVERRIGVERLGAREEPAPDEREQFAAVIAGCVSERPGARSS